MNRTQGIVRFIIYKLLTYFFNPTGHYGRVADYYDSILIPVRHKETPLIQEKLQLKPDDVLVDIGGGTGWMTHRLWKAAGLKEPALCVDPSAAMLEKAKEREGVTPVLATAEQFFSSPSQVPFNKVLFSGSFHHIPNQKAMLHEMAKRLPVGGCCLIVSRTYLPAFLSQPVYLKDEEQVALLRDAGLEVSTERQCITSNLSKTQWYSMIRGRFLSSLENFTDRQIEEEIEALEKNKLQGVDSVTLEINYLLFSAWKS